MNVLQRQKSTAFLYSHQTNCPDPFFIPIIPLAKRSLVNLIILTVFTGIHRFFRVSFQTHLKVFLEKEKVSNLTMGSLFQMFDKVSILFSDVVTFTEICSRITPMEVVSMLNGMYSIFDKLTERNGVYKVSIETDFTAVLLKF